MDLSQAEQLFKKYYDKLIWETIWARAHLKLWERLESYRTSYLKELKQAPHFFNLTMKAHLDDALLTLSRILDKSKGDPLTIWKFLNFIEQNKEIFSVKSHIPITPKVIQEDEQKLENLKETMDSLKGWRDNVLAHNDRQFYLKGKVISEEYHLQRQQLQEVIDTLFKILNRYSHAYNSSIWREKALGEDDVQNVMDFIRFHIQERKKQIEELRRQAHDKK